LNVKRWNIFAIRPFLIYGYVSLLRQGIGNHSSLFLNFVVIFYFSYQ